MADQKWLSAAECALRTGLTVRTLHVYEREGLLKPPRSESGWRRYGHAEIARLSVITSLKELGLTLAQIREVTSARPPPLARLLQIQGEIWRQRHAAAVRALALLDRAENRLTTNQTLSLDELCELVKGLEENRSPDMHNTHALIREVINESLSAEEERALHTWWAQHPGDLAQRQEMAASLRPAVEAADRLAEQQADPACPEAQALVKRQNELMTLYGARERVLRQLEWNPAITLKICRMGPKMVSLREDGVARPGTAWPLPAPPAVHSARGARFLATAAALSVSHQDLAELIRDVQKLMGSRADPASAGAASLMQRLDEICRLHGLGDPFVYVQWLRLMSQVPPEARARAVNDGEALAFMARALGGRDGRRPVDFPAWQEEPGSPAAADTPAETTPAPHPADDRLTPDEEYALKMWYAQNPADVARGMAFGRERKALLVELEALAAQGVSPSADAAQALAQRHNVATLQHGVREADLRLVAFNPTIVLKLRRAIWKARKSSTDVGVLGTQTAMDFLQAARRASSWGQSLARMHGDVQDLIRSGVDPASPEADDLVKELRRLCLAHSLGEADVYARHARFLAGVTPNYSSELVCGDEQTWDFLTRAIQAREGA
jgi:MerR family transcriptional regulator, thiopeptide resistance regulator